MAKNIKKKFKPKEEKDIAKEELKGLEDLPLVGGLFKGLEKFIDLVESVEEAGGKIERKGEIKGLGGKESIRGIYGFTIRTGIGAKERPRIQTFGNIKETKKGPQVVETREPICDVFDEKDHVLIVAELPGVNRENIKLELKGDIITLQAEDGKKTTTHPPHPSTPRSARSRPLYYKEVLLPAKVDFEGREENFKNGLLEVKLKKIEKNKNK